MKCQEGKENKTTRRGDAFSTQGVPLPTTEERQRKLDRIAELLHRDPRMPLTTMSTLTGISVSTLFDLLRDLRAHYDMNVVFVPKPRKEAGHRAGMTPSSPGPMMRQE